MTDLLSRLRHRSALGVTLIFVLSTMLALGATFLHPATSHAKQEQVTGAVYTTVDETMDGTGHCLSGSGTVNCNIYDGKQYVWLNGGPTAGQIGDGTYFFAVLDPGGQADPNDGSAKNLSSPNDAYTNRIFTISGGTVSYLGTHDFDSANNKIRLMPYNDTTNNGGEYTMAVCSLADANPANGTPGVNPNDCKYDNFKAKGPTIVPLTVTKDASGSYTNTFTWGIQKGVDNTKVINSSGSALFNYTVKVTHAPGTISNVTVTGTITVFNGNVDADNNTLAVTGVNVTDTLSNGTACTVSNGANQTLTAAQTDFPYTCNLPGLPQDQLDNTVTVTWPQQVLDGSTLDGDTANFTFPAITFTGTMVDDCATVTDTVTDTVNVNSGTPTTTTIGAFCADGTSSGVDSSTYAVAYDSSTGTFTITYSSTVTGTPGTCVTQDNTATFTTNTTGKTDSASQSVQMCTPVDLQVTKNATPGFTRTYNWSIAKSASPKLIEQIGGTATVTYTVTVTQTGSTDSGWQAKGTITLTNPNDFFDFTGVTVTDAVDDGGTCTVSSGTNVTVPEGQTVTLSYTCSYSSQPAYNATATNTATATWDGASFKTPHSTGSGQATFTFNDGTAGNPNEVNKCVTVTDSFAGTLGTEDCVGTDPVVKTFTYSRTFTVPANNCVTYPNTATIGVGQPASASVEVCGPAKTGALTMGFWQNKNGQGIISAANQANLGSWLRAYHPFSDAPSTGLATYVSNIIKAANCSGTACNTMLRAQMLATALDVYFSDPTLGGNKISAPAPIGGVTIDLTKICQMIDGSGGTATCSGTFENVSSAFGGATSMTVANMLLYQNTSDPLADKGAVWYGQVKATQVLAKDAFDAINNQVAFAP